LPLLLPRRYYSQQQTSRSPIAPPVSVYRIASLLSHPLPIVPRVLSLNDRSTSSSSSLYHASFFLPLSSLLFALFRTLLVSRLPFCFSLHIQLWSFLCVHSLRAEVRWMAATSFDGDAHASPKKEPRKAQPKAH